jgi:hypothetical protein
MEERVLLRAIFRTLIEIPDSHEPEADDPHAASDKIIKRSCKKAGLLSASLSLPTGPLGLITLLPDLTGVWRIQSQMVLDIASAYGEPKRLSREEMLFFLFRHSVSHLVGEIVTKSGERYIVRKLSERAFGNIVERLALRIGGRLTLRATKIVFPLVGSAFLGMYSYRDTLRVGATTKRYFGMQNEPTLGDEETPDSPPLGIAESDSSFGSSGETRRESQAVVREPGI